MATAELIRGTVNRNGEMDVKNLARALFKSEATIRNTLNKGNIAGVEVAKNGKKLVARPAGNNNDSGATTHSTGKSNKPTAIDRKTVKSMREDMDRELEAVAAKYGVQIETGGATYDPEGNFATFKVKVSAIGEDGTVRSKEAEDFKRNAGRFGLRADMLGQSFEMNDRVLTITGLSTKAKKNPVIVEDTNGKGFRVPAHVVSRKLS